MATVTNTAGNNGSEYFDVTMGDDRTVTLLTANTYTDKNIVFNVLDNDAYSYIDENNELVISKDTTSTDGPASSMYDDTQLWAAVNGLQTSKADADDVQDIEKILDYYPVWSRTGFVGGNTYYYVTGTNDGIDIPFKAGTYKVHTILESADGTTDVSTISYGIYLKVGSAAASRLSGNVTNNQGNRTFTLTEDSTISLWLYGSGGKFGTFNNPKLNIEIYMGENQMKQLSTRISALQTALTGVETLANEVDTLIGSD